MTSRRIHDRPSLGEQRPSSVPPRIAASSPRPVPEPHPAMTYPNFNLQPSTAFSDLPPQPPHAKSCPLQTRADGPGPLDSVNGARPPHLSILRPNSAPGRKDLPGAGARVDSAGADRGPGGDVQALDLMLLLQRSAPSVVKTRSGSVLSRGFILKTDHYPSGRALDLDINVHGAPNFRAPRVPSDRAPPLHVFGVAQPRTQGLRAILSVLRCRPGVQGATHVVWFSTREEPIVYISGRPFVLRDASEPRRTLALSDRAENLEGIEKRLKGDILQESARFGGLILTHNEVASSTDDGEGAILPTWTAVDIDGGNVKTPRELWASMKKEGWDVDYHRIPISPDRPIEDNYLDAYLRVILSHDARRTALVFNCGMGAVRTTFAMVAACVVRARQAARRAEEWRCAEEERGRGQQEVDEKAEGGRGRKGIPGVNGTATAIVTNGRISPRSSGLNTPTTAPPETRLKETLSQASAQQELSKSLLRLTYLIQQTLQSSGPSRSSSALTLLISHPSLLENLRRAHAGNYGVILSLLGCLGDGIKAKRLVDQWIDACDHVTNLREDILVYRLRYSLTSGDESESQREAWLDKARRALEKYFFMIAFASYVDESEGSGFKQPFSDWLKARTEIWNQVVFLRKMHGSRLNVFSPINDLSALSKTGSEDQARSARAKGQRNDVEVAGGQILGDEYSDHVVKNRSGIILREGTLLKSDQWFSESQAVENGVRGAINFRNIPGTKIYALGQPTLEAIDEVVSRVKRAHPSSDTMVWITLREEPIVYVNGAPFCLRREGFSLRNMKDYGGISASRLAMLEDRLRDDVVAEVKSFGERLLLHTETPDGSVIPIWEEVEPENVAVLKDVMAEREHNIRGIQLHYKRIPITAEQTPDYSDISDLLDVVVRNSNVPIVVNDQLGRGRSTLAAVIIHLIQQWLERSWLAASSAPAMMSRALSVPGGMGMLGSPPQRPRHSYQVINNLVRVIQSGATVKNAVDEAIDKCGAVYNLRDSIEDARAKAEMETDERRKKSSAQRGLQNLRRYFDLIVFESYLRSTEPDTMVSFESIESFVKSRPVIKTFAKELLADRVNVLKPLERAEVTEGVAHPDEVQQVVMNRSGAILSASTILKSDFFSNLQKMSLPERIEGSPNFRRGPLTLRLTPSGLSSPVDMTRPGSGEDSRMVCGSGMPTVQGLKRVLARVDAGPGGKNMVFWTSLREEPVIYVAGRPHVLRLVDKPLENVEATGVTTAMVEAMEERFKKDVLREVQAMHNRILLHDEVEERPGVFSIIPMWEVVSEEDIMTPRDVFNLAVSEGYRVDYSRVAITDEQAPLPDALSQLLERITTGLSQAGDFIFNCQMGRGRTTTGMVTACLIASTMNWEQEKADIIGGYETPEFYDSMDGPSEEEAYMQGEYKMILRLVSVLSHGKIAKRLTDRAIDLMQDVQNLRKAIYDYKLKVEACEKGSAKYKKLMDVAVNYLYRYATLIVFANYLIETQESSMDSPGYTPQSFPQWLQEHREITHILARRLLD